MRIAMRTLLPVLAAVASIALAAPPSASADASDMTCTIESLTTGGNIHWAWWGLFWREPDETGGTSLSGSASCVHAKNGTFRATLSGDVTVHSVCEFGYNSTEIYGNQPWSYLQIKLDNGLVDRRPFRMSDPAAGVQTMSVDGGPETNVAWHYDNPCPGSNGNTGGPITFSGSFIVPVSTQNPKLFAKAEGSPGHPDPIAVNDATGRVYVGSFTTAITVLADRPAPSLQPSRVTEYDLNGTKLRDWSIAGENQQDGHGLTGIALDSAGRLYMSAVGPARVIRLDPSSGAQSTYATIPDFDESAQSRFGNRKPLPNGAAFGPDGSLYVTDTTQGVIWRVPPGGGTAQKWFTDARLVSFIGPNGIRLMADQKTLLFVVSNSQPPGALDGLQGKIYKLPITTTGAPGALATFWTGATNEGPDSLAIAQSGNVYVAEAGDGARTGFVVLSPSGRELARRAAPVNRLSADIAYDTTADVAFAGTRALFTNSANFSGNVANMAIFAYDVGDPGLPLLKPTVP
jgi:sugar lactone lactonase YvrE